MIIETKSINLKITEYVIIDYRYESDLALEVRRMLKEGWSLWGGPYFDSYHERHCQALVR